MKNIRRGIASALLLALCISNSVSVAAATVSQSQSPIEVSNQSATIQATIGAATASYYVEIPESMDLGTLDTQKDFEQGYTVRVSMEDKAETTRVTISADEQFSMSRLETEKEKNTHSLICHNDFPTKSFTQSGSADGMLSIAKQDIAAAPQGRYSGTLQFRIQYAREEKPDPVVPTDKPSETNTPTAPPTPTPAKPVIPVPTSTPTVQPTAKPMDPTVPDATGGQTVYYRGTVSMRKATDFDAVSMCNGLFHSNVEIVSKDGVATITLYVVNPIPQFAEEGAPLKDVELTYQGKHYAATVKTEKVLKQFDAAPGFIATAGEYSASPIVVTLPMQAVEDSKGGQLMCSAFVDAVMKATQEFYVVFDDLVPVEGAAQNRPAPSAKPKPNPTKKPTAPTKSTEKANQLTADTGEKTYYTSTVTMRKATDFHAISMCNALFYPKAEIVYQGETAKLILYIIDPIPKFAESGTPLSDIAFTYQDKTYTATLNTGGKTTKDFAQAPGFIETAGAYDASPIEVVLPKSAIQDSIDGKLMCSAYIKAVMNTTQDFYVVLDDLKQTSGQAGASGKTGKSGKTSTGKDAAQTIDSDTAMQDSNGQANQPKEVTASGKQDEILKCKVDTKLFPQVFGFVLFTIVVMGGAFAVIWLRRR